MVEGASTVLDAQCASCGALYPLEGDLTTCRSCGPIRGTLEIRYDFGALQGRFGPDLLAGRLDSTIWRYAEILPICDLSRIVPIPVGTTPLIELDVGLEFRLPKRVWIKDDTRNPSGSSKDRATAVGMARAGEIGARVVAAASTGNAASSLAMFASKARLDCYIFLPASAPLPKLTQIRTYGARIFQVEGSYDEAFDLCTEVCGRYGFYNRNSAINPFLSEGKKTIALEIYEQLGFRAPDAVVVPVGDGCILGGIAKGFADLLALGAIAQAPKLIGVQAEGAAALTTAWREGKEICTPGGTETIADSIAVSVPRDQVKALRAVRASHGAFVTVSDTAILASVASLASRAGLLAEPASAAALAGLEVACGTGAIEEDEEVVFVLTGSGLKDVESLQAAAKWNDPVRVAPRLDAVEKSIATGRPVWKR